MKEQSINMNSNPSGKSSNPLGHESIGKLMLRFSIPAIISGLVSALYNIVDQIFIGQYVGQLGMAATNVAFPLTTIASSIALLLGVGGASNFNLYLGADDEKRATAVATNSLSLMVVSGFILSIIMLIFLEPLLRIFGATDKIMGHAMVYTKITAYGLPLFIFSVGASHIIRADGSPNYSMFTNIAGAITNIILDAVFIIKLDMGMAGAAWATIIGQAVSSLVSIYYFLRKSEYIKFNKELLMPNMNYLKMISSLGAAACFNQLAMTVFQIVMNNSLAYYGGLSKYGSEIPLAAVGAVSKILVILMAFIIGIAQGSQPITGYNYGAKKYNRVKKSYSIALILTTIVSIIAFILFQTYPREIMSIFGSGSEEYFEFATKYMKIFMMMTFLNGLQPVAAFTFTSIGKARLGLWMSLTRQIFPQVPLVIILPRIFGIDGIMYAGPASDLTAALLAIYFLIRETKEINELQEEQNQINKTCQVI